jgi:hypothetical protein
MKIQFFLHIFQKYSNAKFHENPPSGNRVVSRGRTDGQADRHDEANSRFLEFCERFPKMDGAVYPRHVFNVVFLIVIIYFILFFCFTIFFFCGAATQRESWPPHS